MAGGVDAELNQIHGTAAEAQRWSSSWCPARQSLVLTSPPWQECVRISPCEVLPVFAAHSLLPKIVLKGFAREDTFRHTFWHLLSTQTPLGASHKFYQCFSIPQIFGPKNEPLNSS